jgi:hypothetical protein
MQNMKQKETKTKNNKQKLIKQGSTKFNIHNALTKGPQKLNHSSKTALGLMYNKYQDSSNIQSFPKKQQRTIEEKK